MSNLHKQKLIEIINFCKQLTNKPSFHFPDKIKKDLDYIVKITPNQKAIYTVIITSATYKLVTPNQDIRKHKIIIPGGYSGRSFDTKYITPTLMIEGLTHMKVSGWLTRSLEQSHAFDKNFPGQIKVGKREFLNIIDYIQNNSSECENILKYLIYEDLQFKKKHKIVVTTLKNPEKVTFLSFFSSINNFIFNDYKTSGGSKIPVILTYCLLSVLLNEFNKFKNCRISKLGSHTASDRTSKTSGDIEIYKNNEFYESFEVKFNIIINEQLLLRACDKIYKFNPKKYFILTTDKDVVAEHEKERISHHIKNVRLNHGCQIILQNFNKFFFYYSSMIEDLNILINLINKNIFDDEELKLIHKEFWKKEVSKGFF